MLTKTQLTVQSIRSQIADSLAHLEKELHSSVLRGENVVLAYGNGWYVASEKGNTPSAIIATRWTMERAERIAPEVTNGDGEHPTPTLYVDALRADIKRCNDALALLDGIAS